MSCPSCCGCPRSRSFTSGRASTSTSCWAAAAAAVSRSRARRADGRALELHVRRASSDGFHGAGLRRDDRGALLRIEGPLGQFWLRGESPRPPLMIGGGTGYAPLRAMLRQLIAERRSARRSRCTGVCAPRRICTSTPGSRARARAPRFRVPAGAFASGRGRWPLDAAAGLVHEAVLADHPAPGGLRRLRGGPAGDDRSDPRDVCRARPAARAALLRLVRLRARHARPDAGCAGLALSSARPQWLAARRRPAAVHPQPLTTLEGRCWTEDWCLARLVRARRTVAGVAESSRRPSLGDTVSSVKRCSSCGEHLR